MQSMPKHTLLKVSDAGHACYLEQTDLFHKELVQFAHRVFSLS
jgi:pimeloyl-ACP methyl ester carboxylesterase